MKLLTFFDVNPPFTEIDENRLQSGGIVNTEEGDKPTVFRLIRPTCSGVVFGAENRDMIDSGVCVAQRSRTESRELTDVSLESLLVVHGRVIDVLITDDFSLRPH